MPGPLAKARKLTLCIASSCALLGCARSPDAGPGEGRVAIPAPSLAGSVLSNAPEQPALVLLPASYASSGRAYPTIYFLPGFTTDVTEYIDGSFNGLDLRRVMAAHGAAHPGAEAIAVIVNGRNALGGSFYVNSPVTGRWEDDVVLDVVPWIDAHYRTIRRREARLLAGEGMGGLGALHLAMRHPDLFGAVYALSPEVFDEKGLDDQGMLSRPALVKAWRIESERIAGWPAAEGPARLLQFVGELYAANSQRFNRSRAFAYAYGAAFAPDPGGGPPFMAYPLRESAGTTVMDPERRRLWEDGYGGWEAKIAAHREGLRSLRAIGLDIGRNDALAWVPRGARRVADLLRQSGIEPEVNEHDGGHWDRLGERIEQGLLPFIARHVAAGNIATAER
ncbi:MAG: esterase family protein [Acidobacteriia bacterium]|nr:esterase family protein [Terriglobia bacterium]